MRDSLKDVLINADSLQYLQTLPDNHIDLIVTDPPYYRVKSCAWDNQWETVDDYLAWLDDILYQFWRVLKPTGSLYLFSGSTLAAKTEMLVAQRFNVLNHIVWAKPTGPWNKMHKPDLRRYFSATERIIFAEHSDSVSIGKNIGYATKVSQVRADILRPLIEYFISARKQTKVSAREINQVTSTQMCSHWFSASQWQLPSEKQYQALQKLFASKTYELGLFKEYQVLVRDYQLLNEEYQQLKKKLECLRRPFFVTDKVPFTDVWQHKSVPYYVGKHPCEKPAIMLENMINASSREGDLVADFFMGSGSTIKAAIKLKRHYIGVELEEERFLQTVSEVE